MQILDYKSQEQPELNARIMRVIESLVCRHRNILPNGWRCIIEFQNYNNDTEPYYILDIQSNQGGGDYAPTKMQMLKHFPDRHATGGDTPADIISALQLLKSTSHCPDKRISSTVADPILEKLSKIKRLSELDSDYWEVLAHYGITHWYGAIRIPYEILATEHGGPTLSGKSANQSVKTIPGEIRISFSGAKEWEDAFIALCIFGNIQSILSDLWNQDQIWYNLRGISADPHLAFWLDMLNINEA